MSDLINGPVLAASLEELRYLVFEGMKGENGADGRSLIVNDLGHAAYWDDETEQYVDTGIEVEGIPGPQGPKGDRGEGIPDLSDVEPGDVLTVGLNGELVAAKAAKQVTILKHYVEASGSHAEHEITVTSAGVEMPVGGLTIANSIADGIHPIIVDYPFGNSHVYKPEVIFGGTQVQFRSTDMNGSVSGLVVPWESSIAVPFTAIGDLPTPNAQTDLGKVPTVNASGGYSLQTPSGGDGAFVINVTGNTSDGFSTTATAAEIVAHKNNLVVACNGLIYHFKGAMTSDPNSYYWFYFASEVPENDRLDVSWLRIKCENGSVAVTMFDGDMPYLPLPASQQNGKFLSAANGNYALVNDPGKIPRAAMTASDTAPTLEPNKLYVFPEMVSLAITLAAPSDSAVANEYHFLFESGSTPATLTIPAAIRQPDGFTVDANHVYEISILEGNMTAQGWAVSTS